MDIPLNKAEQMADRSKASKKAARAAKPRAPRGRSAAANWAARWTRGMASSVPDRSANRGLMDTHTNCKYCAAGIAEPHQAEPVRRSRKKK